MVTVNGPCCAAVTGEAKHSEGGKDALRDCPLDEISISSLSKGSNLWIFPGPCRRVSQVAQDTDAALKVLLAPSYFSSTSQRRAGRRFPSLQL